MIIVSIAAYLLIFASIACGPYQNQLTTNTLSAGMNNEAPLVSVCTITYNHEQFIEQAIRSVLEQKIDFRIEFVIGDDFSKDGNREIINRYYEQYPDIIVPLLPPHNLGAKQNAINCMQRCTGKYIAFLEGDDYWSDPYKLAKQVAFMEANPEYTMCFTDADVIDETGRELGNPFEPATREDYTIEDVIMADKVFIPTATLFFRNMLPDPIPKFFREAISGDIAIHLVISDKGKIKRLPGVTAIYRHHPGGITKTPYVLAKAHKAQFEMYEGANEYFGYKYDAVFRKRLLEMARTQLLYYSGTRKGMAKLRYVWQNSRNYFKYAGANFKDLAYITIVMFFPSLIKSKKKG